MNVLSGFNALDGEPTERGTKANEDCEGVKSMVDRSHPVAVESTVKQKTTAHVARQ